MTELPAQNFQPQVGDTTNGAQDHTYIPRSDGAIMFNGIPYYPVGAVPGAPTGPVPSPNQPVMPTVQLATPPFPYFDPNSFYYASVSLFGLDLFFFLTFLNHATC